MNKFKVGDRVKRIASAHEGMKVGDVAVVKSIVDEWNLHLEGYSFAHDPQNFELVTSADEKETISKFLRENKWFIRTGSPEKSKLVQEWLFEHGMKWHDGTKHTLNYSEDFLSSYGDSFGTHGKDVLTDSSRQEITPEFETIVKSVKLPETPKPTEQELRIIELEQTIAQASAQIKQLKEGV